MLVGCLSAGRSVAELATGQQAADGAAPVVLKVVEDETAPAVVWGGKNIRDLHQEYRNIFRKGNRNAASHLWSAFLLERAGGMTAAKLEEMFTGFCAVSGSPTRPSEHTRSAATSRTRAPAPAAPTACCIAAIPAAGVRRTVHLVCRAALFPLRITLGAALARNWQ